MDLRSKFAQGKQCVSFSPQWCAGFKLTSGAEIQYNIHIYAVVSV